MTTVHAYTSDQPAQDTLHRDLYRARAAALSMIPTSTGAAKALGLVLPELAGKLDGSSIRVPTANVSVVDLNIVPARTATKDEVNQAMRAAAADGPLRGILQVTEDPVVSADLNHVAASATVALPQTQVVDGRLVRVLAWYDNEWGFATRMADVAIALARIA
jgi:glyceraldehyde 3-phosphate dehydrogenase